MEDTKPSSVIEKLKLLPTLPIEADYGIDEDENEESDEYRAFVTIRQPGRRAEMLELIFKNGKRESFAYSHLYRTAYDPEMGIVLFFSEHKVIVKGTCLVSGFRKLQAHRVMALVESDIASSRFAADSRTSAVHKLSVDEITQSR